MADLTVAPPTVAEIIERLSRLLHSLEHGTGLVPAQWQVLRYLARANRYSRTPSAITKFLAATKGTVSQTLQALERKKLVRRHIDPSDRRIVRLELNAAADRALAEDPLLRLASVAADLPPSLGDGLTELLRQMQKDRSHRSFGACATCRFFRRDDAPGQAGGPIAAG